MDHDISRRTFVGLTAVAPIGMAGNTGDWLNLFDGHSMDGWRSSEHKSSWRVVDGALVADGPRSHLFYTGPVSQADFRNFELEVELTTEPDCNSGIYFHTAYQETGFPEKGFEVQINNTARGEGGYIERKKTGSLYGLRNIYKQLVPDGKPFRMRVAVRGKNVQIRLNDELLVDYLEPSPPVIPEGGERMRFLDHGTFALQCHNDGSRAAYRSVRVRPLPGDLPAYTGSAPIVDSTYREIIQIGRHNLPIVDYHVFLRDGMGLEQALKMSRQDGIQYGITAVSTTVKNDADAQRWLRSLAGKPVFCGLYAAEPDWTRAISRTIARGFDYVLADSRTWTDSKNRAVRLWVPEEAKAITNRQEFLDSLLDQTVQRLNSQPVDIYAFPTYLPLSMRAEADQLWTEHRMNKLIDALAQSRVAIEINTPEQLPSRAFIARAKQAGCKFAFGTANNDAAELKRSEYGLQMVEACKLGWQDFFVPGAWWPKAVDRRWPA